MKRAAFMTGVFVVLGIGMFIGFVEAGFSTVSFLSHTPQYKSALQYHLNAVAHLDEMPAAGVVNDDVKSYVSGLIPHPYVGFVKDPGKNANINEYGWHGQTPITKKRPDTVVVAIFGGSVAENTFLASADTLKNELQNSPVFSRKKIEIVSTALGGYKQPQQALALEYMLAQGAEYDIVLNIDGFNEITLPGADNYWQKVAPIFPRSWNWYAQTLLNSKTVYAIVPLYVYQDVRIALARFVASLPFYHLQSAVWYWNTIDTQLDHLSALQTAKLQNMAMSNTTYQTTGPVSELLPDQLMEYSVDVWKRSSMQMASLVSANHSVYVHVLQPTAYFRGSKQLTDGEKKRAFIDEIIADDDTRLQLSFRQLAALGYPKLVQTGHDELASNEYFVDATQIFSGQQEDIYTDMCHYNQIGMNLFTTFLSKNIVAAYQEYTQTAVK